MADTTRPSRARRGTVATEATPANSTPPRKAAAKAAKAAPAKAAPAATGTDERTKTPVILEPAGSTANYAVFVPPKSSGCVGKFYAPLGTAEVKVLLISE